MIASLYMDFTAVSSDQLSFLQAMTLDLNILPNLELLETEIRLSLVCNLFEVSVLQFALVNTCRVCQCKKIYLLYFLNDNAISDTSIVVGATLCGPVCCGSFL